MTHSILTTCYIFCTPRVLQKSDLEGILSPNSRIHPCIYATFPECLAEVFFF